MSIIVGTGYRCDFPGCGTSSSASRDDLRAAGWSIAPPLPIDLPTWMPEIRTYDWCPQHIPPF